MRKKIAIFEELSCKIVRGKFTFFSRIVAKLSENKVIKLLEKTYIFL